MMDKKKQLLFSIVGVLLLVVLTIGVTYAVFTYTRLGTTENTVTAGTLKFLYTENTGVGAGILLEDALPVSDAVGKAYVTEGKVFDFSIEATNTGTEVIPYEITLRKKSTSTLPEDAVKVYLTDMTEDTDSELLTPTLYSNLIQTEVEVGSEVEKTIYTDNVTGNTENYTKNFRLRMWVDEAVDFSNDLYTGKTFTATVNIYSNVPLVSEEELNLRSNADISSITAGKTEMTVVEGQSYSYETILPEGTIETTINVETVNPKSTVAVEKVDNLDNLSYDNTSNIERTAVSKTLTLTEGDNYFKVTVTSQNKVVEKEYGIKVYVGVVEQTLKDAIMKNTLITAEPTLTDSSNNTTDVSGLYKSTATNTGEPTYYFRGNVTNNYVKFAGFTWLIVRINEDGTVRLIMQDGITEGYSKTEFSFNSSNDDKSDMYYSNSDTAKPTLEAWYTSKIASNENYSSKVASGNYYCEQAKAAYCSGSCITNSGASMTVYPSYTPNFKCLTDGNGKGIVNASIGLLSYDEVVHAGGYAGKSNNSYYLYNGTATGEEWWTMSPAGFIYSYPIVWADDKLIYLVVDGARLLRPVINLKADTVVTGSGIVGDEFIVQ